MSRLRFSPTKSSPRPLSKIGRQQIAVAVLCLSVLYLVVSWYFLSQHPPKQLDMAIVNKGVPHKQVALPPVNAALSSSSTSSSSCPFRYYPPHRYYSLEAAQQPDFLTFDTEYIYGKWPRILKGTSPAVKLCVDQTEWRPTTTTTTTTQQLPFADGTNPSLLSVRRLQKAAAAATTTTKDSSSSSSSSLHSLLQHLPTHTAWLATVCMTNSQCQWKDSPQQVQDFHLATQDKPDTIRTLLLFLDAQFAVLQQVTITLTVDHDWGKRIKASKTNPQKRMMIALDDARLFVHDGQVWVSYREGPGFGYEAQVLNPLHFTYNNDNNAVNHHPIEHVYLLASETTTFCCGRNMALMENVQDVSQLLSLTWVDPVTVEKVDTVPQPVPPKRKPRRRLSDHRRLGEQHKSHIHGTNAFMLYVPQINEFLGVAHFHRPNDRQANPYARFGHHYTHAFYTISATPPYHLTRLSSEFVYAATTTNVQQHQDAEIIQFSSGLEMDNENGSGSLVVLAYGINDCEAAVTTVPWSVVDAWLKPVQQGQQVVDLMKPLER